ncbi:hypothetical protein AZI85_03140 [Bdellovibrio bacteriovorus]|uniref:Uncharacterized protein n=1 Tax=Bdellovibrio bacteriovorus TaxID=959 RepID=A0A150WKC9_BDEBC|nr:hypothetical protein [Bdellovibrio bacteriovorus]KYG64431.1 hypothetical protein AZI85_03140 [Bdellovibrio bacteriovorus]
MPHRRSPQDNYSRQQGSHGSERYHGTHRLQREESPRHRSRPVSNYSEGNHGAGYRDEEDERESRRERERNYDNADESMNRDYNRGRRRQAQRGEYLNEPQNISDWAPQDRYNEICQDRFRECHSDHHYPHMGGNHQKNFEYHHNENNTEERFQEDLRRGRHYKEY